MSVEFNRRLQLQQCEVILEGGGVVLPVDDDAAHVPGQRLAWLQVTRYVVLAKHRHQGCEEPGMVWERSCEIQAVVRFFSGSETRHRY